MTLFLALVLIFSSIGLGMSIAGIFYYLGMQQGRIETVNILLNKLPIEDMERIIMLITSNKRGYDNE